jgi:hypothetical protein
MNSAIQDGGVKCGICSNLIPDVIAKSSVVMTALNYPERWDDELESLLCNDCRIQSISAKAWLKHADIRTCIKVGRNAE